MAAYSKWIHLQFIEYRVLTLFVNQPHCVNGNLHGGCIFPRVQVIVQVPGHREPTGASFQGKWAEVP